MTRTKIILHLLTVLALIAAMGLGAIAALSLVCCGRGSSSTVGYQYGNLAFGAVLIAILLQITVIVLKIRNGQDLTREKWVGVFIVGVLVVLASTVIGNQLIRQLTGHEFSGQEWLILPTLSALAFVYVVRRVRRRIS